MRPFFKITSALLLIALLLAFTPQSSTNAEEPTKEQLEQELAHIEQQIAALEQELAVTKTEKNTLAAAIKKLKNEQTRFRLQIKATALHIADLDRKLAATQKKIQETAAKIERLKKQMAGLLRLLNQRDQQLLFETLMGEDGLAGAFVEIKNYSKISAALRRVVQQSKEAQKELAERRLEYSEEQSDAEKLLAIQTIQQKELGNNLTEQADLLKETQGKEALYQSALSDSKKRAAQVRTRIYELIGGVKQISFGEAVQIATWVGNQIGIRPAFLLAILTQESNLGKNVGTCNRAGDPPEKGWRVIMKPERDHEPFLAITSELGKDADTTPVSCPLRDKKGDQIGWGGALGPAQFIPSTWLGYKDKVSAVTGQKPANPWDIRDAFVAAAVKLKADGGSGSTQAEWNAALRYFAGSIKLKFRFYGDSVMKLAEKYQNDIDALNQ